MSRNKITFIILLIPIFLFLQGCQDNIILPDTVNQLQAPRLLYPPDDTTEVDIPMTFSWEGSRNIQDYILQISTDSLFDSIAYSYHGRTSIIRDVIGLNNQTKYYWRVNAVDNYGETKRSTIWNFTTSCHCLGIPTVEYFGKMYNTVKIENQCWLKENLDIGIMIDSLQNQTDNGVIEKYCYRNDTTNCNIYGGLYQWNEAMQYLQGEAIQGICPPGWHIPTIEEFRTCSTAVRGDGNSLKAIGQGRGEGEGTNTSGFSALLSGWRYYHLGGYFRNISWKAYFWSSTDEDSRYALSMLLFDVDSDIYLSGVGNKDNGFSIRCLKD